MYKGKLNEKVNIDIKIDNTNINYTIEYYEDLKILGERMKMNNTKINKSKLCKELKIAFNTLNKRIKNIPLKETRKKPSMIDKYKENIIELLNDKNKSFKSIRILTEVLNNKCNTSFNENTMKYWINNNKDVLELFKISKYGKNTYSSKAVVRFETNIGQQAQFDFKESVKLKMLDGSDMKVYIACLLFSYSRYRIYVLMPDLSSESVIQALAMMFDKAGCVPKEILFDNAKSIMIEARTSQNTGKVNPKLEAFAKDMGFEIKPCVGRRPQTKGKVEAQMKVLDDLYAYSGDLDFDALVKQINKIENRENYRFHHDYEKIPELNFKKEKEALPTLNKELLKSYLPQNFERVINKSGMIKYLNNNYSVDNDYINKKCNVSIFGNYLIINYSTNKFVSHLISEKKFNYTNDFYHKALSKVTNLPLNDDKLKEISKNNLNIFNQEIIKNNTFENKWKE